jgi:hypothetical protein
MALLLIFPRIETIEGTDEGWEKVENAIERSKGIIDCSSKQRPTTTPWSILDDHFTLCFAA